MMKSTNAIKKTTPPSTPCSHKDDEDDPEQQIILPKGVGSSTTKPTKPTTPATKPKPKPTMTTEHTKSSFSIETPPTASITKLNVKREYGDDGTDSDDDSFPPETDYPGRYDRDKDLDKLLGIDKPNNNDEERPSSSATTNTTTGLTSLNEMADEDLSNHRTKNSLLRRCCQQSHPSSTNDSASTTSPPPKVGNSIILNSYLYRRFSLCIIGPTWCGVLFTIALLYFSSYYFVRKAWDEVGMG
eukprot:CAMPEP_0198267666 /NCGR_PEP_ID=MMETSP1447-20131203/34015_1 /TAXON_ID=420782 /ORGANISM="Chaetoceros dichaeta, Strain CCMP1751" /LENGTH=242 /DNA_ID=CAMNT_0043958359 /DNA_START=100 /DNA_END=825 /DNA_ORIENTATION=-